MYKTTVQTACKKRWLDSSSLTVLLCVYFAMLVDVEQGQAVPVLVAGAFAFAFVQNGATTPSLDGFLAARVRLIGFRHAAPKCPMYGNLLPCRRVRTPQVWVR